MADRTLAVTGDPDADHLLNTDPLALLLGMLLDQQVPMEWAFRGPATLAERLGGSLDAADIAARPPSEVEDLFAAKPALHRFPGSMGRRAHALCQYLVDHYDGDAEAIWTRPHEGRPPDALPPGETRPPRGLGVGALRNAHLPLVASTGSKRVPSSRSPVGPV